MDKRRCPCCSSENLEPGKIHSTGNISFKAENTRFLSMQTSNIPLHANMCMDCGYVMLIADLGKAHKLVQRREAY